MNIQWTIGWIFMPIIQWPIDLLNKFIDKIDRWQRRRNGYHNAKRFFQDLNRYRIPGHHWYNEQIYSWLLAEYKLFAQGNGGATNEH